MLSVWQFSESKLRHRKQTQCTSLICIYSRVANSLPPFRTAAQWWVRRFFVLLRREQIDPMVETPTNVLHELCTFQNDNEFAECLSSVLLEDVVTFASGADAGIPAHELLARAAAANERTQLALVASAGGAASAASARAKSGKVRSSKKSMFDDLFNALATVQCAVQTCCISLLLPWFQLPSTVYIVSFFAIQSSLHSNL
jgi:hypothetical protein